LQPLWLDILVLVIPIAAAVTAFLAASQTFQLPPARRLATLLSPVLLVGGLVAYGQLSPASGAPLLARFGGIGILLPIVTVFLLGAAWGAPKRSVSSAFLGVVALIALSVIVVHSSGRLYWRTIAAEAWERFPESNGVLRQSRGFSCAPAAAAMLLHAHGIEISEGELAYRAGTSFLGTDADSLARAIQRVLPPGLRSEVVRSVSDLDGAGDAPFVAYIGGRFAGHAIVVRPLPDGRLEIVDPAFGSVEIESREWLLSIWDRIAVRITPS